MMAIPQQERGKGRTPGAADEQVETGDPGLHLVLYVAGDSPNSTTARRNLAALLGELPASRFVLDEIDVLVSPRLALRDGIVVTPTLLRRDRAGSRRILLGDLSDAARLAAFLA